MSSPYSDPFFALGVPAIVAALGIAAVWWLRRHRPLGSPSLGWEGVAVAAGLGLGVYLVRGWNGLPPGNVNDWPLLLALPAAVLALLAPLGLKTFLPLALGFVALATPLVLSVPLRTWSAGQAALWLPTFALPWLLLLLLARATAERLPGCALPAWGATLGCAAVAAHLGHSDALAMALGGSAVAAGTGAVARLVLGDVLRPAPIAVALAALAPCWWLLAHSLADVPATALVPLAAAPLAAWLAWPLRQRPWTAGVVAAVAAAMVGGGAIWLVSVANPPAPAPGW